MKKTFLISIAIASFILWLIGVIPPIIFAIGIGISLGILIADKISQRKGRDEP